MIIIIIKLNGIEFDLPFCIRRFSSFFFLFSRSMHKPEDLVVLDYKWEAVCFGMVRIPTQNQGTP